MGLDQALALSSSSPRPKLALQREFQSRKLYCVELLFPKSPSWPQVTMPHYVLVCSQSGALGVSKR